MTDKFIYVYFKFMPIIKQNFECGTIIVNIKEDQINIMMNSWTHVYTVQVVSVDHTT